MKIRVFFIFLANYARIQYALLQNEKYITRNLKPLLSLLLLLCSCPCFAQTKKIDSLLSILKTISSSQYSILNTKYSIDTNKINTLNLLAWEISNSKPPKAIAYAQEALQLAEKIKNEKFIANSQHQIGWANYIQGNYEISLEYNFKALKIRESLSNKKGISASLNNIGNIFRNQGDYPKALEFYFKALKIAEEQGFKNGIASALGNIGLVYWNQGNYPKALDYYFKALKMAEAMGDKNGIARHLGNIGLAFYQQKDYTRALDYYLKALQVNQELGRKNGIAINLANIGGIYADKRDFTQATDYFLNALKINEELGNKNGISSLFGNIGSLYTKLAETLPAPKLRQAKFKEAEDYLNRSMELSDSIGELNQMMTVENYLSYLYSQSNRPVQALEHYKKYIAARDTLFSEENKKKSTRTEMNFEFEKKEAVAREAAMAAAAIAAAESKKQKVILFSVSGVLLVVFCFAVFIFRSLRITRKQKHIIELQKTEVEKQKLQVEKQKERVEEHQKEIIDSITYARRIQQALLPQEKYIEKNLNRLIKEN